MKPIKIVIHHEAGNSGFEAVNEYHRQKWNFKSSLGYYIGYHYFIEKSGKVWQGRKDDEIGAHSPPNEGKIGICLQGSFDKESPTEAQILALERVVDRLKLIHGIKEIGGHRNYNKTECPGNNLQKWVLKQKISWLKKLLNIK